MRRGGDPVGRIGAWAALAFLATVSPPLAIPGYGNSAGPLDGLTGAPGESNCTACHASFPLNSGAGQLAVNGLPQAYVPERTYALEIQLSDPDAIRWGFEFTVLDAQGSSAGTLAPTDGATQVSTGGAFLRTYAKHTSAGTQLNQAGSATWLVDWTAPVAGVGDVTLYMAGNAADGSFSSLGDRIYTGSRAAAEGSATGVPAREAAVDLRSHPNPFNPATTLHFRLDRSADVVLQVFDVFGRRIATLVSGSLAAGEHAAAWDGFGDDGRRLPSGLYFARLTDASGRPLARPLKMVMAK